MQLDKDFLEQFSIFSYSPNEYPAPVGEYAEFFRDFKIFINNKHEHFMRTTVSNYFPVELAKKMNKFCLPAVTYFKYNIEVNEEGTEVTFMLPLSIDVDMHAVGYSFDSNGKRVGMGNRSARVGMVVTDKSGTVLFGGVVPFQVWRKKEGYSLVRYSDKTKKRIISAEENGEESSSECGSVTSIPHYPRSANSDEGEEVTEVTNE